MDRSNHYEAAFEGYLQAQRYRSLLRQEFLEFARLNGEHTWQDTVEGEES